MSVRRLELLRSLSQRIGSTGCSSSRRHGLPAVRLLTAGTSRWHARGAPRRRRGNRCRHRGRSWGSSRRRMSTLSMTARPRRSWWSHQALTGRCVPDWTNPRTRPTTTAARAQRHPEGHWCMHVSDVRVQTFDLPPTQNERSPRPCPARRTADRRALGGYGRGQHEP